jgi:hypothetical protein
MPLKDFADDDDAGTPLAYKKAADFWSKAVEAKRARPLDGLTVPQSRIVLGEEVAHLPDQHRPLLIVRDREGNLHAVGSGEGGQTLAVKLGRFDKHTELAAQLARVGCATVAQYRARQAAELAAAGAPRAQGENDGDFLKRGSVRASLAAKQERKGWVK